MKKLSQTDIKSATAAVTCSFIFGILMGTPRLSSLLFVASMTRFGVDRQRASFPFFLCYTIRNASGPLIGYLGGKFGLKNVIILGCLLSSIAVGGCFFAEDIVTITILWGVAFGFSFGLGVALLPQVLSLHFSSHLDKAVGVNVGGECIASFLLTLLTEFLLKTYGLSGTFLILSGVVLHSIPAAMLIQIPNQKTGQNEESSNESDLKSDLVDQNEKSVLFSGKLELKTNRHEFNGNKVSATTSSAKQKLDPKSSLYGFRVFLNPTYILILLTQSTMMYIFTSTNTILVDVSRDHDVSISDAVYVLIGFQVADAVGRFTLGFVTDRGYLSKANFSAVCFVAIGLLLVAFIWIRGFAGMMIFVLGLGVFIGGLKMISASFVMQYVEKDCFSIAIASRFLLYPPISFTQAPLIGFFRDKLQTYNGLFCILIAICCVNSIVSLMVPSMERCRQKRKKCSQ
ncbi:hypothetical protein AVEN_83701-1, partial [Araneus ventricosus]